MDHRTYSPAITEFLLEENNRLKASVSRLESKAKDLEAKVQKLEEEAKRLRDRANGWVYGVDFCR